MNAINLFEEKGDCCGCALCKFVCSQEAIVMIKDEEGFSYPCINQKKCIGCKACIKICPLHCYSKNY